MVWHWILEFDFQRWTNLGQGESGEKPDWGGAWGVTGVQGVKLRSLGCEAIWDVESFGIEQKDEQLTQLNVSRWVMTLVRSQVSGCI